MRLFLNLFVLIGLVACSDAPVGTEKNPLKVMFIPYIEQQTIVTHTTALVKFLESRLSEKMLGTKDGYHIKASIPASYVGVVEAFGTKRADLAAMTTFSYLLAKDAKHYPVEAILTVDRFPDGTTYKGAIIARADSKVKSLKDLNGKKFAFSDPASTSGFILASKLLKDENIHLGQSMFAGRHDTVVSMVYQKQVDAGAIYYSSPEERIENGVKKKYLRDARSTTTTQYPDVEEKIKIIAFTEPVQNEPWVLRTNIYDDAEKQTRLKTAIQEGIIEFAQLPEGKDLMETLVRAEKVLKTNDQAYDSLRRILAELKLDTGSLVK